MSEVKNSSEEDSDPSVQVFSQQGAETRRSVDDGNQQRCHRCLMSCASRELGLEGRGRNDLDAAPVSCPHFFRLASAPRSIVRRLFSFLHLVRP